MYQYVGIGMLICSFCVLLIGIVLLILPDRKIPVYKKKLPKMSARKGFYDAMLKAYKVSGNIQSMLLLLKPKKMSGKARKRVIAAEDYLKYSRPRDFENALGFLNDGSKEAENVLGEILELEIRKLNGLECKENG